MDPVIIIFGFGVGVLVGMTGMGGGSLMTPLLILVFAIKPVVAVGTDIAYSAITKSVGGWRHLRLKTVDLGLTLWLALGSVPGAILGVKMIGVIRDHYGDGVNSVVLISLAIALLVVGTLFLVRVLFIPRNPDGERQSVSLTAVKKAATVFLGAVLGFLVGLTSIGSGLFIALFMLTVYKLAPRRVVGTDVFHAAILLWAAGLAHGLAGNIDYALAGSILLGSIPGVWVGSHLSVKLPEGILRTALGVVLVASGVSLLQKQGIGLPVEALVALPVALILAISIKHIVGRAKRPAPDGRVAPETVR